MGTIKNSFIKCIVKAARVNKMKILVFIVALKRYTLAVYLSRTCHLFICHLICSESLRMCRKAFKIWHFLCKKAHIKHCGGALDFKNHAKYVCMEVSWLLWLLWWCAHKGSLVLLEKWALYPLGWAFIYLDEWCFLLCFCCGKELNSSIEKNWT